MRSGSSDCVWPGAQAEGKSQAERFLGLGFWVLLPRESDEQKPCAVQFAFWKAAPLTRYLSGGSKVRAGDALWWGPVLFSAADPSHPLATPSQAPLGCSIGYFPQLV